MVEVGLSKGGRSKPKTYLRLSIYGYQYIVVLKICMPHGVMIISENLRYELLCILLWGNLKNTKKRMWCNTFSTLKTIQSLKCTWTQDGPVNTLKYYDNCKLTI